MSLEKGIFGSRSAALTNRGTLRLLTPVPGVSITEFNFVRIGEIADETGMIDLPDNTRQSDGYTKAGETEIELAMHDTESVQVMDILRELARNGSAGYKADFLLTYDTANNETVRGKQLTGVFVTAKSSPEITQGEEGEMATFTYTVQYDSAFDA